MRGQVWRCQCPRLCDDDGDSCWSDVTQEDFLCDWCRVNCALVLVGPSPAVLPQPEQENQR